jgi:hypothetical protein
MRLLVWHVLEASAKLSVEPFFGSIKPTQWRYCILYDIFLYLRTVYEFKDIENTESDKNYVNEIINDWSFRGISTTHEGYNPIVNQDSQLGDRLAFWVARRIMNFCQEIKYLHSNIEF